MKYQPPVGAAANAPYVDGNPATGTEGSAVPARAIEHPQREILWVIQASGLTPDENDLTQLGTAVALIAAAQAPAVEGFAVGDIKSALKITPDAGWLRLNGDTIGKAGSPAIRANAAYEALFKVLWDNLANAQAPVDGGRGASAQADWDAGKTLQLPDTRGRSPIGAGAGAGLTLDLPLGGTYGEEKHLQTLAELASHNHGSRYTTDANQANDNNPNGVMMIDGSASSAISNTIVQPAGSGQPFNVVHPVFALNYFIKFRSGP